jgi:hypothetical protein
MADTVGQIDIRGINITKFVSGFRDEDTVLKGFCRVYKTEAREIRWMQKTAGYVAPTTTTGITTNFGVNKGSGSLAPITNQSWTRNTSYVRKYYIQSELITSEDERDTQVAVLSTMIRDFIQGIGSLVDTRIYNVGTESLSPSAILTAAAVGLWSSATLGNPILDILKGLESIRTNRYKINARNKGVLYMHPAEHRHLMNFIISVKGSSVPAVSSTAVISPSAIMEILDLDVVVSINATTDYAWIFVPKTTVAWAEFMPLTAEVERVVGLGKIIHCWEEGEAMLEHPKSSYLITNTV